MIADRLWYYAEIGFDYTPHILPFLIIAGYLFYGKWKQKYHSSVANLLVALVYGAVFGFLGFLAFLSISFRYHNIGW